VTASEVAAAPAATEVPVATEVTEESSDEIALDGTAVMEEGYWYSRYNLGNLVMRSGLGEPFMPDMDAIQQMVQAVDANPDDGDTATPPMNATLLQAVYASGDPHYVQPIDVADFGTQKWDPATFDTTVTTPAMGWTIIKESEWAKQFHVDDHFGTVDDDFGAQWRFAGMVLNAESKMQLQYALETMMNADGYFADSDGKVDFTGQWVMLEALSDVAGTLSAETLPHSSTNRYADPEQAMMFMGAADTLFSTLADRQPEGVYETSMAAQALAWYAANTGDTDRQAAALARLPELGDALMAAETVDAAEKASAVRGLIEVNRLSGGEAYLTAAAGLFDEMSSEFDPESGVFASQDTYTIDDVGVIMGALNSLKFFGGDAVDQQAVMDTFIAFFDNAVNQSGLQQSVPPIPVAKGEFEQDEPPIWYGYPTIPIPPEAGGEFGIAPVFAGEVGWDPYGESWAVTNGDFDSAGAMHASNEFIWFHKDEINGFPEVTAP